MSGIIGGAGSKSGVIGTTELDYEEGSWTPVNTTYSMSHADGKYIKIGNKVQLWGKLQFDSSVSNSNAWSGLPFNSASDPTSKGVGGTCNWTGIDIGGTTLSPRIVNETTWHWFSASDNGTWTDQFNVVSSDQLQFTIVYYTA